MFNDTLNKTKTFMMRNARPIELARWRYHFDNGSSEAVILALMSYQNPDGGFGHGLEPDSWNPYSSPIQTWYAMEILEEIGIEDPQHTMIQGILGFLDSKSDFDNDFWFNTIPTNNDYPHAPWWQHEPKTEDDHDYNPTAYIAGFILRFADHDSELYYLGKRIAQKAILSFNLNYEKNEMHLMACFAHLASDIRKLGITDFIGFETMELYLTERVKTLIDQDLDLWDSGYVCKPSRFIKDRNSPFYPLNKEAAEAECLDIKEKQSQDGTWEVTWDWTNYTYQWPIAKNWWKSILILNNLLYLKNFDQLADHTENETLDGS